MNRTNRVLLGIIGFVLLLAGVTVVLIATAALGRLLDLAGTGLYQPAPDGSILPPVGLPGWLHWVLLGGGVVLGVLAIGWLLGNVPRVHQATPFRLHDDPAEGTTEVAPSALDKAIAREIIQLPGALAAEVSVSGAAMAPRLIVRVTVDDRTDLAGVVAAIGEDIAGGLELALGHPLSRLGVLVDVDRRTASDSVATLEPQ
jgi:hypothetical protein